MFCLIYFLTTMLRFASASATEKPSYTISMVSSEENHGRPALFTHAESPVWDHNSQSLYFVDVTAQNVHRLDYATGRIHTKHISYGQVNVVSLIAESRRLLVAVRSALYILNWEGVGDKALRLLKTVDEGLPNNVINEGKPDAEGRFWFGTKGPQTGEDVLVDKATLYSIEEDALTCPRIHLRPISISNGLVWSPNNSVMYYTDSATQKVEAFDFNLQKGDISARRTIMDIRLYGFEDAIPDGMTIDYNGNLWVAIMFGGHVLHINPDNRQLIKSYKFPVTRTSSVAWGGPHLDELFVTTGRDQLNEDSEPLAGAIFTLRGTGNRGVISGAFQFDRADSY